MKSRSSTLCVAALGLLAGCAGQQGAVQVSERTLVIPTYEVGRDDPFLHSGAIMS